MRHFVPGLAVTLGLGKMNFFSDDFHSFALVALLILPGSGLDTACNSNKLALDEVPADKLSGFTPGNDINEIGLSCSPCRVKLRFTARVKDVTELLLGVLRSSGSATSRPMRMALFSMADSSSYSLATMMERMIPSVILYTRSSSAGNSGLASNSTRV